MAFVFLVNVVDYTKNSGVKIRQNQQKHFQPDFHLYCNKKTIQGPIWDFNGKSKPRIISLDIFEVPPKRTGLKI